MDYSIVVSLSSPQFPVRCDSRPQPMYLNIGSEFLVRWFMQFPTVNPSTANIKGLDCLPPIAVRWTLSTCFGDFLGCRLCPSQDPPDFG